MALKFITFEGGEGSGKSTIINLLVERLTKEGYKVISTREPGGVSVSEQIRNVILNKENTMSNETEALLYAASRIEHLNKKVLPYLNEGYIVISDRYLDSSLAYQGVARGLGIEDVLKVNMYATKYMPIRTYFFDVTPDVGLKRIEGRDKIDRLDLESMSFHEKVYQGYLELLKLYPDRIKRIDGKKDINSIFEIVYQDILKVINND